MTLFNFSVAIKSGLGMSEGEDGKRVESKISKDDKRNKKQERKHSSCSKQRRIKQRERRTNFKLGGNLNAWKGIKKRIVQTHWLKAPFKSKEGKIRISKKTEKWSHRLQNKIRKATWLTKGPAFQLTDRHKYRERETYRLNNRYKDQQTDTQKGIASTLMETQRNRWTDRHTDRLSSEQ